MRKSLRQIFIKEVRSKSTNNLLLKIKLEVTPPALPSGKKSLPKLSKEAIQSGVESISIPKRYSILSVPKTPNTYSEISQGTTPSKQSETSDSLYQSHTVDSTRTSSQCAYSVNFKFSNKNSRIHIGNRFRKNPNQENLKLALEEIEKNPSKKFIIAGLKEKETPIVTRKSDIEVLLESQGNIQKHGKSAEKQPKAKPIGLSELKDPKDPIDVSVDVESMVSDPSPVREKKIEIKVSRTPRRKRKLAKDRSKMLDFLAKSKAGREFIEKFQDQSRIFEMGEETPATSKENINRTLVDYRQESLKILKDTSFFANKIMKAIRCPGRIKKCYYAN